ncbi:MAG: ATP-dependent DNA helicase RecG [Alphaproteobacteria bacterium]
MRQELFNFLNTDLQFIKGVGPVLASRFEDVLGGRRVLDFLLHKPAYIRHRDIIDSVSDIEPGTIITIELQIKSHHRGSSFGRRRHPTRIICADKMGNRVTIQFFNAHYLDYWLQKLPIGQWRIISGKLENSSGPIINHPEFIETIENAKNIPSIQTVYPTGEGLTQKLFTNIRNQIFTKLIDIAHNEPDDRCREFFDSLYQIHFPQQDDDLTPHSSYILKLAYCELLAHQSAIAISRKNRISVRNRRPIRVAKHKYTDDFIKTLPFTLTDAQTSVLQEIFTDMDKDIPMMRLVQGDVGCGKTIIALISALKMAESGGQSVLLAPTDALAQQHFQKIKPMCDNIGIICDVLTGRDKGVSRREKLTSLRSGRTKIVIGTHALFSDDVIYKDLGLVIIDEQHRFGVNQRETMRAKGNNTDLLALSATPIPRTLSMTMYGDMDISIIKQKPAGRLPIITSKLPISRTSDLIDRITPQINSGAKVFWICPLVQDETGDGAAAAVARHEYLSNIFKNVGLVHGQMDKNERDKIMSEFADNNSKMSLLVATTVIEVGIDVPKASIIIIENPELFGLATLHQLRGRVGRGNTQSYCILLFGKNISPDGLKRLDILCETNDGFVIAEQDLMMRGIGELLGTRQSGWINYHFADWREHRDLFKLATRAAADNYNEDWTHDLMYIFNCGENIYA